MSFRPRVLLHLSEKLLVRTRNPKVHTVFLVRVSLIFKSESLNFRFLEQMINWKHASGDKSLKPQNPEIRNHELEVA